MVLEVYDFNQDPVTGLVDGDFDKYVTLNGANDATAVTVSEIANGRYEASFTPGSNGMWSVLIRQTSGAAYNKRGWQEDFDVTTDGVLSLSAIVNAIFDSVDSLIEVGFTFRDTMRLMSAVLCGKASGGPGNSVFRNMPDTADRVTSVADSSGNRTVMTLTP